jgi:ABC-type sugar transport system ATPase subunit
MKIVLDAVSKSFRTLRGGVAAVEDIHLTVEDGEFLVLLGPSGCGKSTLLNLIAGLEEPTSGRISFDSRVMASPAERVFVAPGGRNAAMVFQNYALYPHMTVFDNIAFPLRVAKDKSRDIPAAVKEAARMLAIGEILNRKPGELSGGQRQRVAIARALVRRPSVFLLDEPLSNLDPQLRVSTRTELKRLQAELGVTTLYVTHDQMEATTLGHRVALLRAGRIIQIGTPGELYARPATAFVAAFIGSPPMNLIESRLMGDMVDVDGATQVGIRPEALTLRDAATPGATELSGTVSTIEPLGREVLYHLDAGGTDVLVLHPEETFRVGQVVYAGFDPRAVHRFDAEGRRIE